LVRKPADAGLKGRAWGPSALGAEIEIDDGALVLIRSDAAGVKVVRRDVDEGSTAVDGNFVMLGILEAMAE
jgi:hypothetical protein